MDFGSVGGRFSAASFGLFADLVQLVVVVVLERLHDPRVGDVDLLERLEGMLELKNSVEKPELIS